MLLRLQHYEVTATLDLPYSRFDGEDPMVIMAHGSGPRPFWVSHDLNGSWVDVLSGTFKASNVSHIAYTARGCGESTGWEETAVADVEQFTWERLADDMIDFADTHGLERFVSLGVSMGSATSIYAGIKHPERFLGMILICLPTSWESRETRRAEYVAAALQLEHDYPEYKRYKQVILGYALSGLPDKDQVGMYAQIKCPVLILALENNALHPLSTALVMSKLIPQSKLVVTKFHAEAKIAWKSHILSFIHSLRR